MVKLGHGVTHPAIQGDVTMAFSFADLVDAVETYPQSFIQIEIIDAESRTKPSTSTRSARSRSKSPTPAR
jgi:hypothetical protein